MELLKNIAFALIDSKYPSDEFLFQLSESIYEKTKEELKVFLPKSSITKNSMTVRFNGFKFSIQKQS